MSCREPDEVKVSRPDLKTGDWVNPSPSLLIKLYMLIVLNSRKKPKVFSLGQNNKDNSFRIIEVFNILCPRFSIRKTRRSRRSYTSATWILKIL